MTANAYKGKSGGDPSRRPPKLKRNTPCAHCQSNVEFMASGKGIPVLFCSEKCKYENRKTVIIASLRKHGINLNVHKNRSSTSLGSLLNLCEMIQAVSKGRKIYTSPVRKCATCNQDFSYLSLIPITDVRLYCSGICNKNRSSRTTDKNSGTLCPRPEKLRFNSLADADSHLRTMVDGDIARNRDLTSYLCVCGHVHFGSMEKSIFEKEERELIEKKQEELYFLLADKPHLKVKSGR